MDRRLWTASVIWGMLNYHKNILLIVVDDLRADCVGSQDKTPSLTPQLDNFGSKSIIFDQAISCGGWTRPSMIGALTSTYASMYGGPLGRLSPNRPYLPEILNNNGYHTAGFVSNPQIGREYGFNRGFDTFTECEPVSPANRPPWEKIKGSQRLFRSSLPHWILCRIGVNSLPPAVTISAEQLADKVRLWINRCSDGSFIVLAHFMDVHWPYHVHRELVDPKNIALAWRDTHLMYSLAQDHGKTAPAEYQRNRLRSLYRSAVRYVDDSIGYLLGELDRIGVLDNMAVIIVSDHGEEFFEHGRWGHYQLYDESIRVPLIIHLPGSAICERFVDQVSLIDLTPTVLEIAGIKKPDNMLGESLLRYIRDGESGPGESYAEAMWPDTYRLAIRSEDYKYLFDSKRPDQARLFDLRADPEESFDISKRAISTFERFENLCREHIRKFEILSDQPGRDVALSHEIEARLRALGYWDPHYSVELK